MEEKKITMPMLMRLPGYLDYLNSLPEGDDVTISATAIATALGLGDVLVRKDLALVSGGGKRKIGHNRDQLIRDIEHFLDHSNAAHAVLVGAGRLGQALMCFEDFEHQGMNILAAFDHNPEGKQIDNGRPVLPMEKLRPFCFRNRVRIGIITVPAIDAQSVCDQLIDSGVEAIWNFAPVNLNVPEHILIQNVNLKACLAALRMQQIKQSRQRERESSWMAV